MSSRSFLCIATVAVVLFLQAEGKICLPSFAHCGDDQTCCLDGCCESGYSICCGQYERCCSSDYSVCCPDGCCSSNYPVCCPGKTCCSAAYPNCCPNGCCPASSPHCCSDGCCPSTYPVCCTTHCCPSGYYCCPQGCCTSLLGLFGRSTRGVPLVSSDSKEEEHMVHYALAIESVKPEEDCQDAEEISFAEGSEAVQHSVLSREAPSLSGPCNSYEREKLNEGYHTHVYMDSEGIRSIGVGFNLEKAGAQEQIESVGADYDEVLSGREGLTDSQIQALFDQDMNTAVSCASLWLPQWSILGLSPQSAIADMAFNLGCTRLAGFKCLRKALSRSPPDFKWAVEEMRDSKWCDQVGARCDRDIACMQ